MIIVMSEMSGKCMYLSSVEQSKPTIELLVRTAEYAVSKERTATTKHTQSQK